MLNYNLLSLPKKNADIFLLEDNVSGEPNTSLSALKQKHTNQKTHGKETEKPKHKIPVALPLEALR